MLPYLLALSLVAPSDTLPVPHAYLSALEAGTRSRSGEPGTGYWQQRVDYQIRAQLNPEESRVRGSETITYHNQSPDTLTEIWLNLAQNVFAPGNPRNRPAPVTGGFSLDRMVVQGRPRILQPVRGAVSLATVVPVSLDTPLAPEGTATLEIDWSFMVPEGTFRMGRDGSEVFFLAQWYPQIAVYDDLRGWIRDPYMGDGEFYLEYGDFHVEITAPGGWLVSASGILQNPDEVLLPEAAARLRAVTRDEVTPVVGREDRDAGRSTAPGGPDGTLTWRYEAEDVRDFAWGASDRYVWDATVATYAAADGTTRSATIHSLYRPDRPNWERSAEFARHAIESHSTWLPYPYPQMTVNEGVIGGGMEYPMITIVGGGRSPISLYSVISHELAHMWWPMVVGSDERSHAWMDEGLASFAEDLATPKLFPGVDSGLNTMNGYLRIAGSDEETESMRPADLYGPHGNRGTASYGKPASAFRALRTILTERVFDQAMRTYIRRWAFKHPHPLDLFWTFEDVSGGDLDWYFLPWMYTTGVLDQAVVEVRDEGGRQAVVVEDRGEIAMPVILRVSTDAGQTGHIMTAHDVWEDGRAVIPVAMPGRVIEVVIDPDERFPDVNRADNRWTAGHP
jgi:hypothetical protein